MIPHIKKKSRAGQITWHISYKVTCMLCVICVLNKTEWEMYKFFRSEIEKLASPVALILVVYIQSELNNISALKQIAWGA